MRCGVLERGRLYTDVWTSSPPGFNGALGFVVSPVLRLLYFIYGGQCSTSRLKLLLRGRYEDGLAVLQRLRGGVTCVRLAFVEAQRRTWRYRGAREEDKVGRVGFSRCFEFPSCLRNVESGQHAF